MHARCSTNMHIFQCVESQRIFPMRLRFPPEFISMGNSREKNRFKFQVFQVLGNSFIEIFPAFRAILIYENNSVTKLFDALSLTKLEKLEKNRIAHLFIVKIF